MSEAETLTHGSRFQEPTLKTPGFLGTDFDVLALASKLLVRGVAGSASRDLQQDHRADCILRVYRSVARPVDGSFAVVFAGQATTRSEELLAEIQAEQVADARAGSAWPAIASAFATKPQRQMPGTAQASTMRRAREASAAALVGVWPSRRPLERMWRAILDVSGHWMEAFKVPSGRSVRPKGLHGGQPSEQTEGDEQPGTPSDRE